MPRQAFRVGVIGGGAFGTAMSCVLRRSGHEVVLWAREPEVVSTINRERRNDAFLKGIELQEGIEATNDMAHAAAQADFILLAPPAQRMREVTHALRAFVKPGTPVVSCSKGIERGTHALMPEVLAESLPASPVAVLSGPSFAKEIAVDMPCGVVLACKDPVLAEHLSHAIANPRFCVHPGDDVVGAAIGGVMKNVIAIASGVAAGRGLGENARATVVTLGVAESVRLGVAKGARRETFDGLAGIGDAMLTANSLQSRNTSLGFALGEGQALKDVLSKRKEVTEGAFSTEGVVALAAQLDVDMPIARAVDRVLNHGATVDAEIDRLLGAMG
jgi:glycerol-3-phosphate dehydrogenase (NAD(P)+)